MNRLIERLTQAAPDIRLIRTFLVTYHSFVSPDRLFTKLMQRYDQISFFLYFHLFSASLLDCSDPCSSISLFFFSWIVNSEYAVFLAYPSRSCYRPFTFEVPIEAGLKDDEILTIRLRVCNVLRQWIETDFSPFTPKMLQRVVWLIYWFLLRTPFYF